MNGKKAKLLRRFATADYNKGQREHFQLIYTSKQVKTLMRRFTRGDYKEWKRIYNAIPRPERARFVEHISNIMRKQNEA